MLQVEDRPGDAELVAVALERAGYEIFSHRVEDAQGMREALARQSWDVVIADYHVPGFDAPDSLRLLRDCGEDIPFIVVSASLGESLAVDMMRAGASDYLTKGNLARLVPAVEREVREARERNDRARTKERFELGIQAAQIGTFDYFPQSGKLAWSDICRHHLGLPPDAQPSYDLFLRAIHPDDRGIVHRALQSALLLGDDRRCTLEFRTVGLEGGVVKSVSCLGQLLCDPQGRPAHFTGAMQDISGWKRLEEQFRQAQKLESIGRLAGGVAHDFNNLLTVISGYAHMVIDALSVDDPLRVLVQEISKASDLAATLTRQLLTFSRRQTVDPKKFAINDVVRDLERMIHRLIGEDVELALNLGAEAGSIRADRGSIEQILMNLAVNARDAMPLGGRLKIETGARYEENQPLVALIVSDTGAGMPPEVQSRIFEPFFTTKESGKGTGLGLSMVYGIVKQSNGRIEVESEPGGGTTFTMLFPAVHGETEQAAERVAECPASGAETILLVEDDPALRGLIQQILEEHGYGVLSTANGQEALEIALGPANAVDLVVADAVMPVMGGVELAEKLAIARPGLPLLLMSGYPDRRVVNGSRMLEYIDKPFTAEALLTGLQRVLQPSERAVSQRGHQ